MRKINLFIFIFAIFTLSGCASTIQKETVAPGQLTLAEIMGTDEATLKEEAARKNEIKKPSGILTERVSFLESEVKRLTKNQNGLKGRQDNVIAQVNKNSERIARLEKHTLSMQKKVEVFRNKKGARALPSIELKDSSNISGFQSGGYQLSETMKIKIEATSAFIKKFNKEVREDGKRLQVLIEGWADSSGDPVYNENLSRNRAIMSRIYLKSLLSEEELSDISINIRAMGSKKHIGSQYRNIVIRFYKI